jgi:hypothetical protein
MTEMTIRQILDAMARALDKTASRFANQKPDQMKEHTERRQALEDAADQSYESRRPG